MKTIQFLIVVLLFSSCKTETIHIEDCSSPIEAGKTYKICTPPIPDDLKSMLPEQAFKWPNGIIVTVTEIQNGVVQYRDVRETEYTFFSYRTIEDFNEERQNCPCDSQPASGRWRIKPDSSMRIIDVKYYRKPGVV